MSNKVFYPILIAAIGGLIAIMLLGGNTEKVSTELIGEFYEEAGTLHVAPGQQTTPYNSLPATSGDHGEKIGYGEYQQELTDYDVLHGLEHGGVALSYNPSTITEEELSQVRETFESFVFNKKYLSPRSDLGDNVKLAMVAWNYLLEQEAIDTQEMAAFFNGHINKGPELAP